MEEFEKSEMIKKIKQYIESGYVEVCGYDIEGFPLYRLTDKFFELHPEIQRSLHVYDSDLINSLWFKGFIDVSLDELGEPYFSLTEKSLFWEISMELDDDEKAMMYDIICYSNYIQENEGE